MIKYILALWHESIKRLPYILGILVVLGAYGVWQSYRKTTETVQIAKDNTADIKSLIQGQTDLLNAINQVTIDNKLTSQQKTDTIICMLQVPVSLRTTDTENRCRKQAEAQSNPTPASTSPSATETTQAKNNPGSSNQNPSTPPRDNSILPGDQDPVWGCVNLPFGSRKICF